MKCLVLLRCIDHIAQSQLSRLRYKQPTRLKYFHILHKETKITKTCVNTLAIYCKLNCAVRNLVGGF